MPLRNPWLSLDNSQVCGRMMRVRSNERQKKWPDRTIKLTDYQTIPVLRFAVERSEVRWQWFSTHPSSKSNFWTLCWRGGRSLLSDVPLFKSIFLDSQLPRLATVIRKWSVFSVSTITTKMDWDMKRQSPWSVYRWWFVSLYVHGRWQGFYRSDDRRWICFNHPIQFNPTTTFCSNKMWHQWNLQVFPNEYKG
jgi:hypothetical protein